MQYSLHLFEEVRTCLHDPTRAENTERLATVAKSVSQALRECLACLPGQQDLDAAINMIDEMIRQLSLSSITSSSRSYQQVQVRKGTICAFSSYGTSSLLLFSRTLFTNSL